MLNSQARAVAFGDICSLVKKKVSSADGAIPCVELENIESGNPKLNGFTTTDLIKSQKTAFQAGDVLFGKCRPYLRKTWFSTFDGACSTEIWVLRANTEFVVPEYLHAIVQSERFNEHANLTSGTKMPRADWSHVSKFEVQLPSIEKQREIAATLSTWDRAIELHDKLIALKEKQKQGLMQVLLTGKKRLLDDNGVPFSNKLKHSLLGDFLTEKNVRNKSLSVLRVFSVTNDRGLVLSEEQFPKRVASKDVSNYKILHSDDYGYNPSRLNVGSIGRLKDYENGLLSPMYIVFGLNLSIINSDFFWYWIKSDQAKHQISASTQGSVRDSVSFDALCRLEILTPCLVEQSKIAKVLLASDLEINALKSKRNLLNKQKQGLMQQLLG